MQKRGLILKIDGEQMRKMQTRPTKTNDGKVPVKKYSTVDMWLLQRELNECGKTNLQWLNSESETWQIDTAATQRKQSFSHKL